MHRSWGTLALSLLLVFPARGADDAGKFVEHTTRLPAGGSARFMVWLPAGFTPDRYWPAVVFLHGKEQSGTDNTRQTEVGLGPVLRSGRRVWPGVIVFPQKAEADVLWGTLDEMVLTVLAAARAAYPIDTRRIYLTGVGQGGEGTWSIAAEHPGTFAAVVPVGGWTDAPDGVAQALRTTAVWVFHGRNDAEVPAAKAQKIAAALQKDGHPPRVTIVTGDAEETWTRAYRRRDLPKWLFKWRRP
ncbi:MAG TPA: dienelactone hydrolase family protein [Candidatus Polarisedimenticolaceae bacterium]|nr:dienelactone hydrolase family protein [Candidatus Polarisedimenticolaceae bacterium]